MYIQVYMYSDIHIKVFSSNNVHRGINLPRKYSLTRHPHPRPLNPQTVQAPHF